MPRTQFVNPQPIRKWEVTFIFINSDGNKECKEQVYTGPIHEIVENINKAFDRPRIADIYEVM